MAALTVGSASALTTPTATKCKRSRRSASCWPTTARPGWCSWTSRLGCRKAMKDASATPRPGSYSAGLGGQVSSQRQLAGRYFRLNVHQETTIEPPRLNASMLEKRLTNSPFAIAPKIAEVDKVLRDRGASAAPPVREVHPEVCFWALHDGQPMRFRKKTREGRSERFRVLQEINPQTQGIYDSALKRCLRKQVARDDILDALAAAVTAKLGLGCPDDFQLRTLPECPPTDGRACRWRWYT